jgi:small GTP-binding protein
LNREANRIPSISFCRILFFTTSASPSNFINWPRLRQRPFDPFDYRKLFNSHSFSMAATTIRIIVIGDAAVGKTQMMIRYCDNQFNQTGTSTVGVDFKTKSVTLDGIPYKIQIWDTAGQERFRNIVENYYRRAQGIILVYDVTNADTFQSLNEWFSSIDKYANPNTPVIICGNKTDLPAVIPLDDAESLAQSKGTSIFLTSAANGEGISEAFQAIAQTVIAATPGNSPASTEPAPALVPAPPKKKKGICVV